MIIRFIKSLFTFMPSVIPSKENLALNAMKDGNITPIVELMTGPTIFNNSNRSQISASGRITICHDIYGPEVKIDQGELLDCAPSYYGLSYDDGQLVYNAILGNASRARKWGNNESRQSE
jgi:hypothetical protein